MEHCPVTTTDGNGGQLCGFDREAFFCLACKVRQIPLTLELELWAGMFHFMAFLLIHS